ncbi:TPA: gas vesicle protein [Yersinia enterocolitica]|nr:gas vesicle protein [Yersinia enterocolitica]
MESGTNKTQEITLEEVITRKTKDQDLMYLVRMANFGVGVGVTLFSKGTIITGTLMSGKEYYETVASKLSEVGEFGAVLAEYYTHKAKELYTPSDDADKEMPLNFLHLKESSFFKGDGGLLKMQNSVLRIKIEEIDGHYIGN